jgi:hypothetical protein
MLGSELVTLLEGLVDDTINENLAIALMDSAKENIESERQWNYLQDEQEYSVSANTDFSSDLPDDFSEVKAVFDEDGKELLQTTREESVNAGSYKYYI